MKIPIKCPKCHKPLLNESMLNRKGEFWRKVCLGVDHEFWCMFDDSLDEVTGFAIVIDINIPITAHWVYGNQDGAKQQLYIVKGRNVDVYKHGIWIPFFEPDLSNYNKLIQKLKTYITFS